MLFRSSDIGKVKVRDQALKGLPGHVPVRGAPHKEPAFFCRLCNPKKRRERDGRFVETEHDPLATTIKGHGEYLFRSMLSEDFLKGSGTDSLELGDTPFTGEVAANGTDEQEDTVRVEVEHGYGFTGDRVDIEVRIRVFFQYGPLFVVIHATVSGHIFRNFACPFAITAFHDNFLLVFNPHTGSFERGSEWIRRRSSWIVSIIYFSKMLTIFLWPSENSRGVPCRVSIFEETRDMRQNGPVWNICQCFAGR